jgi:hypothetical protein
MRWCDGWALLPDRAAGMKPEQDSEAGEADDAEEVVVREDRSGALGISCAQATR